MQGNEAIARGALEAGIRFAAAYPGSPSSEILAMLAMWPKKWIFMRNGPPMRLALWKHAWGLLLPGYAPCVS
jgi:indolepyruvate ferredoxin oxidoreductase alpha subunit